MLILWKGLGFVVALLAVVALVLTQLVVNLVAGSGTYEGDSNLWVGVAFAASGVLVLTLGLTWNAEDRRTFRDPATGQSVVVPAQHTFFFVPMQWWGLAMFIGGVGGAVYGVMAEL